MNRIRVLYFLNSPVRAGVEEHVLCLIARLDRQRFVVALAAPEALLATMKNDLSALSVDTYPVEATGWRRVGEVRRLARIMRRFRPDIVHAHLFRATLVAAPVATLMRVPTVLETYHGREAWRHGPIKGRFFVDRFIARLVDRIIAVSEAAAVFLVRTKGIPEGKVTVIANGCDLSRFHPASDQRDAARHEFEIPDGAPVVGVIGRLETQKGHRYLIDALPEILREFPTVKVLVVGDGSLRSDLEAQARDRGVRSAMIFAGFRPDVPRIMSGMDIAVLPSLHEGMPLTAIESAAMGIPVIATAVDGTPEVVQHERTGLLVPAQDPAALTNAIRRLLRDPDFARKLGTTAREVALDSFDVERQVQRTAQLYLAAVTG